MIIVNFNFLRIEKNRRKKNEEKCIFFSKIHNFFSFEYFYLKF